MQWPLKSFEARDRQVQARQGSCISDQSRQLSKSS